MKAAAPLVRVDGALDGALTPKATLTALASAVAASGRTAPLMDEIAFTPGAGGREEPLASREPADAHHRPPVHVPRPAGDRRRAQRRGLRACTGLVGLPLVRRGRDPRPLRRQQRPARAGGSGGTGARPGLQDVLDYDSSGRSGPRTDPRTGTRSGTRANPHRARRRRRAWPPPTSSSSPAASRSRRRRGSTSAAPPRASILVTMQRAADGVPVLARRGAIPRAGARTVTLPKARVAAGSYRFSVWVVGTGRTRVRSASSAATSSRPAEPRRACRRRSGREASRRCSRAPAARPSRPPPRSARGSSPGAPACAPGASSTRRGPCGAPAAPRRRAPRHPARAARQWTHLRQQENETRAG